MARWRRKGWYADVLRREFERQREIREAAAKAPAQALPQDYAQLEVQDGQFPFDEPKQLTFPFPTEGGS